MSANLKRKGVRPPTTLNVRKLRVPALSDGVVCVILRLAVLIQYRRVTDRKTDSQTHRHTMTANTRIARAGRVKKGHVNLTMRLLRAICRPLAGT